MRHKSCLPKGWLKLLLCAPACVLAICAQSFAQSAPADSVIIDSVAVTAGQHATLTVRLNNTQSLVSFSLPLAYPKALLTLDSISWVGARTDLQGIGWYTLDAANGRILITLTGLTEPYVPPGRGILARLFFATAGGAPDGSLAKVDTLIYPPNQPLYARNTALEDSAPFFAPGVVEINEVNYAPAISVGADYTVDEGRQVQFIVAVTDPNGDVVTVSMAGAPNSATLTDLGGGNHRFSWTPDYTGVYSAAVSPRSITFHATDGALTQSKTVAIWVANVNRPPVFSLPSVTPVKARETVTLALAAADPDMEPLTISCLTELAGYEVQGTNPWTFVWPTTNADVGVTAIRFVCADEYAAADTLDIEITVMEFAAYSLRIAEVEGYGGQEVSVAVSLRTEESIGAMDLSIVYDPLALALGGINRVGGGLESWEFVDVSEYPVSSGNVLHLVGFADMVGGATTPPLPPSDTVLFSIKFVLANDVQFHNQQVPLHFYMGSSTTNLLSDPLGDLIPRDEVEFVAGSVFIKKPADYLIGDLNLNGIAYEVGDAVRFINYFIYGESMALNTAQRANGDCNGDGLQATVADLVFLIRIITEE